MSEKEKDNFISLSEATKYCDYSQAYLNLRVRQGKLKAVKFGRNWMTKKKWIEDYVAKMKEQNGNFNGDYISLKEATKYCNYSHTYLNLRIRQGKLKAVKFGRNWMTKKKWIEDYVAKAKEYKEEIKTKAASAKTPTAPDALPVGRFNIFAPSNLIKKQIRRPFVFQFVAVTAVILLVLVFTTSLTLRTEKIFPGRPQKVSSYIEAFGEAGDFIIKEGLASISEISNLVREKGIAGFYVFSEPGINQVKKSGKTGLSFLNSNLGYLGTETNQINWTKLFGLWIRQRIS